ncbi:MAG: Holliday junction resolvase RuvX [Candidatus Brocadiales bacterium]|nr:Holliday junction resolvase RuvX [Candidatus Bathyanammoxibius sp.]MCQ4575193.1 Holliday junction resolvase RuvX [Candidatus Bathyanammoxibius amoris]
MRILGIDYGRKRIGLAVSDPLCITAQGLPTLERGDLSGHDMDVLAGVIREREVDEIVVGLPLNMDGTRGEIAREALAFAGELRKRFALPVHMMDERLSTVRAHRAMKEGGLTRKKRAGKVDKISAQLILQDYLGRKDRRKPGEED